MHAVRSLGSTRPLPLVLLCAFLALLPLSSAQSLSCQEVRTVFQSLHPGSKWVPENPVSGNQPQLLSSTRVGAPHTTRNITLAPLRDLRAKFFLFLTYSFITASSRTAQ